MNYNNELFPIPRPSASVDNDVLDSELFGDDLDPSRDPIDEIDRWEMGLLPKPPVGFRPPKRKRRRNRK